jgi:hypothetical protein
MLLRNKQSVYILDIKDYGAKLIFAIKNVFQYRTNHWSNTEEYEERVRHIKYELIQQLIVLLNYSNDESTFYLGLLQLPNYNSPAFSTIYQYTDTNNQKITDAIIREFGVFLFNEIRTKINPYGGTNIEYVLEQAAYSYIVLSVYKQS